MLLMGWLGSSAQHISVHARLLIGLCPKVMEMTWSHLFVVYRHVGGHFLQNTWLLLAVSPCKRLVGHFRLLKIGVHNEKLFHTTLTPFKMKMARAALTVLAHARPQIISLNHLLGFYRPCIMHDARATMASKRFISFQVTGWDPIVRMS